MSKYSSERYKRYYCTMKGRAYQLYHMARDRAKKRGYDFNITGDWIREKLEAGVCEVTGIPFTFKTEETYGKANNAQPFSPTLDRVDNTQGYTKDNVQVVIAVYNYAKMHWGKEYVIEMAKHLLEKEGIK